MTRYIVHRLLSGLLTLFLFVTLLFFLANIVIPGDFVTSLGIMTADQAAALRAGLGLDQPLYAQYLTWLGSLATLSLGDSLSGGPVWDAVRDAMAPTMVILGTGLLMAFIIGGWLGRIAGYRERSFFTGSATLLSIACLTIFPPALAVAMEQGVQRTVGWWGLGDAGTINAVNWAGTDLSVVSVLWRMCLVFVVSALLLWLIESVVWRFLRRRIPLLVFIISMVALPMLIWSQMGLTGRVLDLAGTMSLLIVAVVLLTFGEVLLVTKASMEDVMMEDYVVVARAKGLPERQVRDHHAARTALLPVLSRFTVAIPYFLTGLVILEIAFGAQGGGGLQTGPILMRFSAPAGLGTLLFRALSTQDTPLLLGALLVVGILTLFLRITLDVAHAGLDPRIRFGGGTNGA